MVHIWSNYRICFHIFVLKIQKLSCSECIEKKNEDINTWSNFSKFDSKINNNARFTQHFTVSLQCIPLVLMQFLYAIYISPQLINSQLQRETRLSKYLQISLLDKIAPNVRPLCFLHKRMTLKLHVKEQSKFSLNSVTVFSHYHAHI